MPPRAEPPVSKGPGAYVFALAGNADADNIAPVIWAASADGTRCLVVVADAGVYDSLCNSWWISERPSVTLRKVVSSDGTPDIRERLRRIMWNRLVVRRWLRRHDARLVAVQWREGVGHDTAGLLRRCMRWWSTGYFTQLQLAAGELGIPTVALPHGHSTKTTIIRSEHVRERSAANAGKLPFADRDSFAAYVFCSDYHRDAILENSDMNPANVVVWGSPRFNDEWVQHTYRATRPADLPALPHGALRRVLFFIPKWQNLVDRAATMKLIAALGADRRVQLVVRGHLRSEAARLTEGERATLDSLHDIVMVADGVSSASLIKACDVVVDIDSSIAFDAVLTGKPYVRPRYLQDRSVGTIWDRLGGAHQTDDLDSTVALLCAPKLEVASRDATFETVVFGGSGSRVLAQYRDGLRAIAGGS